jgi:hypothetical protein
MQGFVVQLACRLLAPECGSQMDARAADACKGGAMLVKDEEGVPTEPYVSFHGCGGGQQWMALRIWGPSGRFAVSASENATLVRPSQVTAANRHTVTRTRLEGRFGFLLKIACDLNCVPRGKNHRGLGIPLCFRGPVRATVGPCA